MSTILLIEKTLQGGNVFKLLTYGMVFCVVLLAATMTSGCSGKGGRGLLNPAIIIAEADSDDDGLPDSLERKLGTDAIDRDTDHDGLTDYYELVQLPSDLGTAVNPSKLDSFNAYDADRDG